MSKMKTAVLISGNGSNLQAIIDAAREPSYPADICLVISNKPDAYGLERAKKAGIKAVVVNHKDFDSRDAFEAEMTRIMEAEGIELVVLAGFMRILNDTFVGHWSHKLINIHPSLLPAFKGTNVYERMINEGVKIAGCTVHFVVPEMDSGPIIAQAEVPVLDGDTADSLSKRILVEEHTLYPRALALVASKQTLGQ